MGHPYRERHTDAEPAKTSTNAPAKPKTTAAKPKTTPSK